MNEDEKEEDEGKKEQEEEIVAGWERGRESDALEASFRINRLTMIQMSCPQLYIPFSPRLVSFWLDVNFDVFEWENWISLDPEQQKAPMKTSEWGL